MDDEQKTGERIAKVLARAGVASRRDAERMIALGRVSVNGRVIDSPALNVGPRDKVAVDGAALAEAEPARLWLYHKPLGLVTTARDEKGRATVFDNLPEGIPRVMPVGRLDITSEGLLLLTNDGELKRRLELPATGWLRRYRVRVHGVPEEARLETLRSGIVVEGERFQGMSVTLDRQQGANAWLTIGLREGRNREIRRAMEAVGLEVNRLIRVGYGPFKLGSIAAGAVEEVKARVLRDQLGLGGVAEDIEAEPKVAPTGAKAARRRVAPRTGAGADHGAGPGGGKARPANAIKSAPRARPAAPNRGGQGKKPSPRPQPGSKGRGPRV